jgi:heme/copper-type cytochrome/quinol oxidase subunit 3
MSTATDTHHDAHGAHDGGHHEPPEVVDRRQKMAIWLFIGGDIVTTSAMLFTYLYLRGLNTDGNWMRMLGYQGHTYAWYQAQSSLPNPTYIHVHPMSPSFNWLVTAVTLLSGLVLWFGEKGLRKSKNAKAFSTVSALATVVVIVAAILSVIQLRHIPAIYFAVNDSQGFGYTAYSSAMMLLIGSTLVHQILLVFLGLGLTIRSARGVINGEKWYQARLVRLFWMWVAISGIVVSAVTTTINTVH